MLLQKFFSQKGYLSIEGLGIFEKKYHQPEYHTVEQYFSAPFESILFSEKATTTSTDYLHYLANQHQISTEAAKDLVSKDVDHILSTIHTNGRYNWKGIGNLHRNASGQLELESEQFFREPDTLPAAKVIRKNEAHLITVGEQEKTNLEMTAFYQDLPVKRSGKWWIMAVVLGLVTIGYLVYYYIVHQSF